MSGENAFGWGGAREGAGRPPADETTPSRAEAKAEYEEQRARHERLKADKAEIELRQRMGELLERSNVELAAATAASVLVQSLRGLRDTLERKYSLPIEALEAVDAEIDAALQNISVAYRALSVPPAS